MKINLTRREALRLLASTSSVFLITLDQTNFATVQAETINAGGTPIVYLTRDISSEGLVKIYRALGRPAEGNVAVKISSGEPGGRYFLSPKLIAPLVQAVNGTIVECNTAYGGPRSATESHQQVMKDHGFTAIAPTDIMDADGLMSLPVVGGTHLQEDIVGSHFANYDFVINLAHFKGHVMGGFGGVIKNMSIGIASSMGKSLIHSAGTSTSGIGFNTPHNEFLESMAEAAKGVADCLGENILYINVMNNLSVDCDCDSSPATPTMRNIGILASLDPVALDQACVDRVYAAPDGQDLIKRMESRNGIHTLEHAEAIGLGSRQYTLVNVDIPLPAPALISPDDRATVSLSLPAFDWTDVPNAANYLLQVDRRRDFLSPNRIDAYSNTSQFVSLVSLADQLWYWRVRAVDQMGNSGVWSGIRMLYVDAEPTPIPTLITPVNDLLTRERVFTFDWSDEASVKRYNIQVNSAADFSGTMRVNANPIASEFRNGFQPLSNGIWYWHVRAQGTDNIWGAWSEVWMINVDLVRPDRPVLTSPAFDEVVKVDPPTFEWLAIGDAVEYILQIDRNFYFRSTDLHTYTGIGTNMHTIPAGVLDDGRWFWRVAAVDAAGNQSFWSANSRFFLDAVETPVPTLVSPASGILTNLPVHTFDWTDEAGVKRYNIQVNSASDFTGAMRVNANPTASQFTNSFQPLTTGTWYWHVRALGTDNIWGDWSATRSLVVDRERPSRPTLATPANGSTVTTSTPTFTWNAVADGDVVGYIIQIDRNYFFASPERIMEQVVGTSYTVPVGSELYDRRWFWRVAAVDEAGNQGPWSGFWNVIVSTTTASTTQVIQSTSPQVQKVGQWQRYNLGGGSYLASRDTSAALSLTFTGSQIEVVFAQQASLGTFAIEIDGELMQTVNCRAPNLKLARVTIPVTPGEHTVRVVTAKGTVAIDAFVITP